MKAHHFVIVAYLVCCFELLSPSLGVEPVSFVADGDPSAASSSDVRAESALAQEGCPGTESCCVAHGSPGCDNASCCNIVCGADPFCCFALWSSDCVSLATQLCGTTCGGSCPGTGVCCVAHDSGGCDDALCCDLVCTRMPSCCEGAWSAACADLAVQICAVCEPPVLCPQPGECCVGRFFTGGCERSGCCRTVCALDRFCCTGEWDNVCAQKARNNCLNVCNCPSFGNFDADPVVDLRDAAAFLNCFSGGGSPPVPSSCACADYDGDGDVDLQDFRVFADLLQSP